MKRKWLLGVLATPVALILVLTLVGWTLPVEHTASGSTVIGRSPPEVFAVIADFGAGATWRRSVESIELLEERDGRAAWIEHGAFGPIPLELVESTPPVRFVTRIADDSLPFAGTWTFELREVDGGSAITITEHGSVRPPVHRFLSRFVFGHHRALEEYLSDLGRSFGEDVRVTRS